MVTMRPILDAAADLLLGATCPACDCPGWGLCVRCWAQLQQPPHAVSRGVPVPVWAACDYRPLLEHVVPRYKDDGALHLAKPLGRLLARAVLAHRPPASAVLVPVPSLPGAVKARGFDHAARLGQLAARATGLPIARGVLARARAGGDQRGLGREAREANLAGSMWASAPDAPVLVLDDVATTGASLREAIRALTTAGAEVIGAAVVADAENSRDAWRDCPPHPLGGR